MSRALIVGHTGQDGRLLRDQLTARGVNVVGISRAGVEIDGATTPLDLLDANAVRALVAKVSPDQVYYLAAHHHSSQDAGMHEVEIWGRSWDVHVHGFGNVLAALAVHAPHARVFYAASSRVFGSAASPLQNESTPRRPLDPYGVTKAAGMMVADYYRRERGLFVCCGLLFNHESPLRGAQFVTQRIVRGLAAIVRGEATTLELGNLDARVDWGYAPDYTRAMQAMLDAHTPDDFVVATGETHSVREFVDIAAGRLGLRWQEHVRETGQLLHRPPQALCGDARYLRRTTGWAPSVGFRAMVHLLTDAAMRHDQAP